MSESGVDKNLNKLIWLSIAICLIPVWYFEYFVTIDGPSHVANAVALKRLITGECPITSEFFEITPYPVPNYLGHIILALLTEVFSPNISEKLLISTYVISFILGLRALVTQLDKSKLYLVMPLSILTMNWSLLSGGYNFSLSITLLLFSIAWWIKNSSSDSILKYFKLTFLTLILYFTHIFGLGIFLIFIACYETYGCLKFISKNSFLILIRKGFYVALAAGPSFILFSIYLGADKNLTLGDKNWYMSILGFVTPIGLSLHRGDDNTTFYTALGITLPIIFSFCLWFLKLTNLVEALKIKKLKFNFFDFFCLVLIFVTLICPPNFGGGWIIELRFHLVFFISLILSFYTASITKKLQNAIVYASFAMICFHISIACIDLGYKNNISKKYNNMIASHIPKNSSILSIDLNWSVIHYDKTIVDLRLPKPHIADYVMARKCSVNVANFHSGEKNTFPTRYEDDLNYNVSLGKFRTEYSDILTPPDLNIRKYESLTGKKIDFITITGRKELLYIDKPPEGYDSEKLYKNLMEQVSSEYDLIFTSTDKITKIYERKQD